MEIYNFIMWQLTTVKVQIKKKSKQSKPVARLATEVKLAMNEVRVVSNSRTL